MSVTGVNQSKNTVSPRGARKAGIYLWGDTEATWGDALATWGGLSLAPTNQSKTASDCTFLITDDSDFIVTDEGDYICISLGAGSVTNQSKS